MHIVRKQFHISIQMTTILYLSINVYNEQACGDGGGKKSSLKWQEKERNQAQKIITAEPLYQQQPDTSVYAC